MNKTIRSGARDIIYKVFMRCLAEYQAGTLLTELEDVYKRTADLTGKSESTVRRIANEGKKNGGKFGTPAKHRKGRTAKVLDDFDISAIRQKIHYFYSVKKEVPTLSKLLAVLKEDINYDGSKEQLRLLLRKIESESEDENDGMTGTSNYVLPQHSEEESMSGIEYLDFESLE